MSTVCGDAGGEARVGEKVVERADLNKDGIIDYLFNAGYYDCVGTAPRFTPTAAAGADATQYLGSTTGKAIEVWSGQVWDTSVGETNGYPDLTVAVAGLDCGESPSKSVADMQGCTRHVRFNRSLKRWKLSIN